MAELTKECIRLPAAGLALSQTLFCGQSFAWHQDPGGFVGVAGRRAVRARHMDADIELENITGAPFTQQDIAFWQRYFSLDLNYAALQARMCCDAVLTASVGATPGMRLLRQPFFDTLLCFILSQNNNIPRIAALAERLRLMFGPQLAPGVYGFPDAETLAAAAPAQLDALQSGYRAPYLLAAARAVAEERVTQQQLELLDDDAARALLQSIPGVGPKVANCVLLFSLERWAVVPEDTWIRKALKQHYPKGLPADISDIAGIAQQYLFWHMRNGQKTTGPSSD